jgi:hypothetical protein
MARAGASEAAIADRDPGDFIEPGSVPEASSMLSGGAGGATSLDQLRSLAASGIIDAGTIEMIEKSLTDASAQIEQLHASGLMDDQVYAQAKAGMLAATSAAGPGIDSAALELLQHGESAAATVLAIPDTTPRPGLQRMAKLEVHPATGSPYPVDCSIPPVPQVADLKAGDFLRVKVDPKDPAKVAIDWVGFGA